MKSERLTKSRYQFPAIGIIFENDKQAWYIYWILKSALGYVNMCFSSEGNPPVWWIRDILLNCLALNC